MTLMTMKVVTAAKVMQAEYYLVMRLVYGWQSLLK